MTLEQKQAIFAINVSALISFIVKNGMNCTFGEAYRTPEQAAIDVQKGTGIADSLHCKRLAVDLQFFDKTGRYLTDYNDYKTAGEFWKTLHVFNRWGGDFKTRVDSNHFEMQDL